MKANPKIIIALLVLLGGTLAQAAAVNDTFGGGSPGTNPDDGNGFISVGTTAYFINLTEGVGSQAPLTISSDLFFNDWTSRIAISTS